MAAQNRVHFLIRAAIVPREHFRMFWPGMQYGHARPQAFFAWTFKARGYFYAQMVAKKQKIKDNGIKMVTSGTKWYIIMPE